jgi:hypothetical protein
MRGELDRVILFLKFGNVDGYTTYNDSNDDF